MLRVTAAVANRAARAVVLASILAGPAACRIPDTAGPFSGVQAVLRDQGAVVVTNHTSEPVFVLVLGREVAMLALWATCVDAAVCPPIPPGASREYPVDLSPIDGISVTAVNVYWWHAVAAPGGGLQPDRVRVEVIPL